MTRRRHHLAVQRDARRRREAQALGRTLAEEVRRRRESRQHTAALAPARAATAPPAAVGPADAVTIPAPPAGGGTASGDDAAHVDHLAAVLAILRPYRRRRLSDAHRAKLIAAGTAALARHRAAANCQGDFPAPESTHGGPDGSEAA